MIVPERHPEAANGRPKDLRMGFFGAIAPQNDDVGRLRIPNFVWILFFLFLSPSFATEEHPAFGRVSDFSFTDQNGHQVIRNDLAGRVWIANFVFTRCQGLCPFLTGTMAQLQNRLPPENIKLVSFSVDPEHDTQEALKKYAGSYHAQDNKWFFLTTEKKETMWDFIANGFRLGAAEATAEDLAAGAEPVMHSTRFVLVDGNGDIRSYYDSQEPARVEQLVHDALELSKKD